MRAVVLSTSTLALMLVAGCNKQSPPPPQVTPPGTVETINGTERIGWTQRAGDASELATMRYAIYVDGTRSELAASCDPNTASADGFSCSARLPSLSAGAHTLELASFITDGGVLESARSAALRVTVSPAVTALPTVTGSDPVAVRSSTNGVRRLTLVVDGERLTAAVVADDLNHPTDLAFAPDGRLFIAEHDGTIRVVHDGTLSAPARVSDPSSGDGQLLAIAVDPDFARTRFVFAVVASGGAFAVTRAREIENTLGDRAVLLDRIPAASTEPSASLRFGPDGKLYVAFDDGGEPRHIGDLASSNGKILRLNADATTPNDQANGSPLWAPGARRPAGFDWQPETGSLLIADGSGALAIVRNESAIDTKRIRGAIHSQTRLPVASTPSAIAFVRGTLGPALTGNLLVASGNGQHLLRVRFDPTDPLRVAAMEPLLQDVVGPIVAVASGPDGAVYFATPRTVWRLAAE